jgi:hypothetical protein
MKVGYDRARDCQKIRSVGGLAISITLTEDKGGLAKSAIGADTSESLMHAAR